MRSAESLFRALAKAVVLLALLPAVVPLIAAVGMIAISILFVLIAAFCVAALRGNAQWALRFASRHRIPQPGEQWHDVSGPFAIMDDTVDQLTLVRPDGAPFRSPAGPSSMMCEVWYETREEFDRLRKPRDRYFVRKTPRNRSALFEDLVAREEAKRILH